ncbi:MAG: hypothetical protein ACFCU5_05550 [Pleurocapsa sp.]
MKRLILATLSTLAILGMANPVSAEQIAAVSTTSIRNNVELTPFSLVTNGYQGYFTNQGIPGHGRYLMAIRTGKIDAESLVEAAITIGRLAPDKINDSSYLNHVRSNLNNLDKN